MKTKGFKLRTAMLLFVGFGVALSSHATEPVTATDSTVMDSQDVVTFKLINDTEEDIHFFSNGGQNTVKKGETKICNWAEGHQVFFYEEGKKGELWFEVTAKMNGGRFKVSEL